MLRPAASVSSVPRRTRLGFEVRSVLRTGRIFDTPPLEGYTFVYFGSRRSTCYRPRRWFGSRQQT